ncbi:hypothetical protein Tco_1550924, partial [Tanacetum coccineum]
MLLLTWRESSEPTKEPVCDSVIPSSLPQHDSSTPCKDSVCESITSRCMPDCMLTPPSDESVITYIQLSDVQGVDTQEHALPIIQEAGFADVARSGVESYGLSHDEYFGVNDLDLNLNKHEPILAEVRTQEPVVEEFRTQEPIMEDVIVEDYVSSGENAEQGIDTAYETEYDLQFSEDVGTNDDDDEDEDFLVDEENELVEPDVDVHLFGISMYVPFDNIGVTNLVPDDILEGEDVDVINANGFDSDLSEDNEISDYMRRRLAELSKEMEGVINASGQWMY